MPQKLELPHVELGRAVIPVVVAGVVVFISWGMYEWSTNPYTPLPPTPPGTSLPPRFAGEGQQLPPNPTDVGDFEKYLAENCVPIINLPHQTRWSATEALQQKHNLPFDQYSKKPVTLVHGDRSVTPYPSIDLFLHPVDGDTVVYKADSLCPGVIEPPQSRLERQNRTVAVQSRTIFHQRGSKPMGVRLNSRVRV